MLVRDPGVNRELEAHEDHVPLHIFDDVYALFVSPWIIAILEQEHQVCQLRGDFGRE